MLWDIQKFKLRMEQPVEILKEFNYFFALCCGCCS